MQPYKLLTWAIITIISLSYTTSQAQSSSAAEQLAAKISVKIKDSLGLTTAQQQQLFAQNMQLYNQKKAIRQKYSGNDSLIRVNLQKIENKRDSMYKPILGPEKYNQYRQKKISLILL